VYLLGRTIFVYLEAEDMEACLARVSAAPVNARWDEFMAAFIEPEMVRLDEVFHMD
jgi:L-rhamnose mutarotase